MSSPTGISAESAAAPRTWARASVALAFAALFATFIGAYRFGTVDSRGTVRDRTAFFVWSWVSSRLTAAGTGVLEPAAWAAALAITVLGFFALIGLAAAVEGDAPAATRSSDVGEMLRRAVAASLPGSRAVRAWVVAAIGALAVFVAWRTGVFGPARAWGVDDTFASFDHPFHVARVATLIRSLQAGHLLRWVANHQGGYPAEFYPFGFAWFEAALWGVAGGTVSIAIVHRVAVILLFVAPGWLFFAMARRDGWPPIVALAAFALHVSVPGDMWGGGYSELVYVGLVANVAASVAVVVAMLAASEAFVDASRRAAAVAAAVAAAAIWCNPRSAIGLVVCVGAAWVVAVAQGAGWRSTTQRLAMIAGLAALLAAPELLSLVRFRQLYFFIRYTSYGNALDYAASWIDVVSMPGFVLAIVGLLAAMYVGRRRFVTRTTSVALAAYVITTLVLSFGVPTTVEQLETTRLMPVQRLLTIYLAAVGLHVVASMAVERWRVSQRAAAIGQVVVIGGLLVAYIGVPRLMPFWSRGLYAVDRSAVPAMATLQSVLTLANEQAPPATAILVVGSAVSSHQQLWGPVRVDRLFFYDDWMWYWHTKHRGPYDPTQSSKYDPLDIADVFDRAYLDENAIGAVVVESNFQLDADSSPALQRVFGGAYGLYLVPHPTPVVTFGGRPADRAAIDNERISADGAGGGDAVVRRNWFPRWRAEVNGRPVPIVQTADGYMKVAVPAGPVRLTLTYALEPADVAARVGGASGLLLLVAAFWKRRGDAGPMRPGLAS